MKEVLRLPKGTTELYVVSSTDVKSNKKLLYKAFHVVARVMKGATWELHWAIISKENLESLTVQAEDLKSKNMYMQDGSLYLLDTVKMSTFEDDGTGLFQLDDDFVIYEEDYKGSIWWLLETLHNIKGEVILKEEYSVPVHSIRFSKSTMTLYYSYQKKAFEWSTTKILWYTDDFHFAEAIKIKVDANQYQMHKGDLAPYIKSQLLTEEMGQTKYILTVDFSKANLVTKDLEDVGYFFIKELLIKDVMLSEMSYAKTKGASHAKFVLEEMMGVEPDEDFQHLTSKSKVEQARNLVFEMDAISPKRSYIMDLMNSEPYRDAILEHLSTGENELLNPLAKKVVGDWGLTVFTKEYFMGLVNSFHVDDEGIFDYKIHNSNVHDYREEYFLTNLNLHKERIQLFVHQFNWGTVYPNAVVQGGEYRLTLKARKVNYNE